MVSTVDIHREREDPVKIKVRMMQAMVSPGLVTAEFVFERPCWKEKSHLPRGPSKCFPVPTFPDLLNVTLHMTLPQMAETDFLISE
jgi:hypothetical protein